MTQAFCDATLFTGEAFVEGHALLVRDGKIIDIAANSKIPGDAKRIACPGKILAPGFIDAQVNGGGNVLLNNTPTAEACLAIAAAHRKHGTTRLLLTCITDKSGVQEKAIKAVREARQKDPGILGIHLEGPYLDVKARGVHKADFIHAPAESELAAYKPEKGEVMLMTVAPESVTPEQIKKLRAQGLIISLGHTQASSEQIKAALAAGATGFTHLFNGMGGMSARATGPAGTALDDRESWCGIIADGHHVNPEMIRLAHRAKPPGKIFLVSDAMPPAAAGSPKPFDLYGETIHMENGCCVNKEGKLAGSSITLADAVRYCTRKAGIELGEALRMASSYPAAFLGLGSRLGKLLPGFEADIIALNQELKPDPVWLAGHT